MHGSLNEKKKKLIYSIQSMDIESVTVEISEMIRKRLVVHAQCPVLTLL
jgi:hypothetical protein